MSMASEKKSFSARMKESVRKALVGLKRKPSNIALCVLVIAFLQYSLSLTAISNTTAKIQGANMGLYGFVTMLFSMLGLVCYGNSFPHRKPVNKPMLALTFIMFGVVIFTDVSYMNTVSYAINREVDPIAVTATTSYITSSISILRWNIVIIALGLLATALLPVYKPFIKRINTSIAVEAAAEMNAIDISGEDA